MRETNEIKQRPTLIRGICIFAFERPTDPRVSGFLMERVRPRSPFAVIRSLPWVLDLESGSVERPSFTRSPFSGHFLADCIADARRG